MAKAAPPLKHWFPTFHKTWVHLGFPGQLAVLTTILIVLCLPIALITLARPTDPRSEAREMGIPITKDQYYRDTTAPQPVKSGCVISGCSSELCVDASQGPIESICLWKDEYACYRSATCERQADGRCGWTLTEGLKACLAGARTPQVTSKVAPTGASKLVSPAPTIKAGICDRACPDGSAPDQLCRCLPAPTSTSYRVTPKVTAKATTYPTPKADPTSSVAQQMCARYGGTWKMFPDSCADTCIALQSERACLMVGTLSCDCGPSRCWNGTACVTNPNSGTQPTNLPQPTPPRSTQTQLCAQAGGTWTMFKNTCVDSCSAKGEGIMCGQAITAGCECGINRCWTGTTCVDETYSGTQPTARPQPTTPAARRPTTLPTSPATNYPPGNVCDLACPDGFYVTNNCMCQPLPPQAGTGTTYGNRPTAITQTLPAVMQNRFYLATIAAQDLDTQDTVNLTVDGLPPGLQLERCLPSQAPGKSLVSCSITGVTTARPGRYPLTLRLTDSQGNTTAQEVAVTIIPPESWFQQFLNRFKAIISLRY